MRILPRRWRRPGPPPPPAPDLPPLNRPDASIEGGWRAWKDQGRLGWRIQSPLPGEGHFLGYVELARARRTLPGLSLPELLTAYLLQCKGKAGKKNGVSTHDRR